MSSSSTNDQDRQARAAFAAGDFSLAESLFRELTHLTANDAMAYYNLGVTLGKLDRVEEAMSCYRHTIELNPNFADAYINFGTCLNELNLITHARQGFAIAHQIEPDNPVPILNEGIAALALGDYATGWDNFSARWRLPLYAKFKRTFAQPYWQGEDLAGKTLLLFSEQGFGDTLQMVRYAPLLSTQGAKLIIESPPALTQLLRSLPGSPMVISKGDPLPNFDFYCSLMDVPRAYKTRVETIPSTVPYLFAKDDMIITYANQAPVGRRRVGLCWAGRSSHQNDTNRSLKFTQLAPLLAQHDVQWINLQRVVSDHDAPLLANSLIIDWSKSFDDFAAAAAAIMALDLVITVDTAIAHLAGALGKAVWILLPFYADWRWLTERQDSPWYPSARLFRQKRRKDWDEVISRVAHEL